MGRNRFHFHTKILIEAIDVDTVVRHLTANGCIEFYKLRKNCILCSGVARFSTHVCTPTSPYTHLTNIIIQIKLIRDSAANYPHDHKLGCKAECEQPDVSSAGKY